ncbi:F-box/FBD/LRR-repeat protein-like protein [Tanacetum coccineum]
MDRISNIPAIETILCFLPIEEAVRTSILSKEWRYRWIKIPKLVFVEEKIQVLTDGVESTDGAESSDGVDLFDEEQAILRPSKRQKMDKKSKLLYDICQVLLMHMGPIHEFTLKMVTDDDSCVEIDRIIFYLSRKTNVKKLTLDLKGFYSLPLSFFSMTQLTDLHLSGCSLDHQSSFTGFGSLTSLSAFEFCISYHKSDFGTIEICADTTIAKLFECLPAIENLSIWRGFIECFSQDGVPRQLSSALVHLKYLCIEDVCFVHDMGLPILFLLVRSSPNLEKLRVQIIDDEICQQIPHIPSAALFTSFEEYQDIWLGHLKELEVTNFDTMTEEWSFLKLILAKSPMLKKVRISYHQLYIDEDHKILKKLSVFRHASKDVDFIFTAMEDDFG